MEFCNGTADESPQAIGALTNAAPRLGGIVSRNMRSGCVVADGDIGNLLASNSPSAVIRDLTHFQQMADVGAVPPI